MNQIKARRLYIEEPEDSCYSDSSEGDTVL